MSDSPRLGAAVPCEPVAGFGRAKALDSNVSGIGERQNMPSLDGKRSRAGNVAGHDHNETRALHNTFPFEIDECHRMGYGTAYSNGAFNAGMGKLIVHPSYRWREVGHELLWIVDERYSRVPFFRL